MLKPIVTQYRKDGWKILLKAALHLALKCAFLEAAIPDYVAFGLELGTFHILRKLLQGAFVFKRKYHANQDKAVKQQSVLIFVRFWYFLKSYVSCLEVDKTTKR